MSRSQKILVVVLLLVVIGVIVGLTQWNKPHRQVESEQGVAITTDSLISVYAANERAADARFLNQTLAVKGTVAEVGKNADGFTTILFQSADPMSSVFCTMRDKGATAEVGKVAVIKGFCSGHTSDVLLTDCIIVK